MSSELDVQSLRYRPPFRLAVVASTLLMAACGTGDPGADSAGPTVAPTRIGGTYEIERLVVDGADATIGELGVDGARRVVIDAEFGGLRIETACGALLGSFTLEADGSAGVTVAGGSTRECSAAAAEQRAELLAALGRVDGWTADDAAAGPAEQLELTSPTDTLILTRR